MKIPYFILPSVILLGSLTAANATNLGFGQLGGNNTTVPANYGSNAIADGNGLVVSLGGVTPNVGLTWDANWDIHTSGNFAALENQFVGGGAWDNEGNIPRIGQLDTSFHTINFTVDSGYELVLTSFDFAQTGESDGTSSWDLTLTNSSTVVVWSQSVTFTSSGGVGQVYVISPNFTGLDGGDYLLTFQRTTTGYPDGRVGIDNLQFSQMTAVPEPATYGVAFAALLGVLVLVRSRAPRKA